MHNDWVPTLMMLFGFFCGLIFNYSSLKFRQMKVDRRIFEEGFSRGIHMAKMAHTSIQNHPERDAITTNLYVRVEATLPQIEELQ